MKTPREELALSALTKIAGWELPATDRVWSTGEPMSYEAAFGSNGARDYIRGLAQKAIAALTAPEEPRAAGEWEDELLRLEQISKELLEFAGDFRDDSEAQNKIEAWSVEICNWTEAGIAQKLRRDLSASRQVVSVEAIMEGLKDFGEKWYADNDIADYTFEQFQEAQATAIHALQLPAPQPVAGIEEAVKSLQQLRARLLDKTVPRVDRILEAIDSVDAILSRLKEAR